MALNAETWTAVEVAEWIAGLETTPDDGYFARYSAFFLSQNVTGKLLLNLMSGDMSRYGVARVGDQLLLQDAIQELRNELDTPRVTLQSLASTLAVRCRNYRSELSLLSTQRVPNTNTNNTGGAYSQFQQNPQINYIPTESLSSASYLLDSSKILIRWLTRFPFLGNVEYDEITAKLAKHCFELAMLSQRDTFADNAIEEVQYLCTKIIEICEGIVYSKDSLVIQPAAMDVITLRKRTEQELGLHVESSYFGLHQVSSTKLSSPAQQSGNLEKGDEILQINYQTVVGWPQKNVIRLLDEDTKEVILTIKRRPRHATANILAHMYLRPSNKLMGSTQRSHKRHNRHAADKLSPSHLTLSSGGLSSSLGLPHGRHQKSMPISPVPEDENSSSSTPSSNGGTPVIPSVPPVSSANQTNEITESQKAEETTNNLSGSENSSSTPVLTAAQSIDTADSDDPSRSPCLGGMNSGSGSGSDSQNTATSNAHSRFWKLYPRPRNLIRRRMTVTGASPTSTRPPVTFFDDDPTEAGKLRPPLINSKSAPEKIRVGLRKQGNVETPTPHPHILLHRQTMPPTVSLDLEMPAPYEDNVAHLTKKADTTKPDLIAPEVSANTKPSVGVERKKPVPAPRTHIPKAASPEKVAKENKTLQSTTVTVGSNDDEKSSPKACSDCFVPSPDNSRDSPSLSDANVILSGILHLRQSPGCTLLIKSSSLTGTISANTGLGFSPHPRWTRHPAKLYSHNKLQIGSDPDSLNISLDSHETSCEISIAKEVHSRPFAFKIEVKPKTKLLNRSTSSTSAEAKSFGIFYLAAECQQEFGNWMKHLLKPEIYENVFRSSSVTTPSGMKDLMYHKLRSSAPPVYKRSISLGNSPAYSRRNSLMSQNPRSGETGSNGFSGSITESSHNRSFILRKNNLLRSSKLVGNSTPNVQGAGNLSMTPQSSSSLSYSASGSKLSAQLASTPSRRANESVKTNWFNSTTPTTPPLGSPKRFFPTLTPPYRSPNSSLNSPSSGFTGPDTASSPSVPNSQNESINSNISSITIQSLVRKSESDSPSASMTKDVKDSSLVDSKNRVKHRSQSASRLPNMGVNIVLVKHNNQSPLSSPKKIAAAASSPTACTGSQFPSRSTLTSPKKGRNSSSTSTSSSSDVFLKTDAESSTVEERRHNKRVVNCPSCGGSTSSSHGVRTVEMRDAGTQTPVQERDSLGTPGTPTPVSPSLELLRHMINEQEGSRV